MRRCKHHTSHRVGTVQGSDRAGRVGRFSIDRFSACGFPGRWRIHHQEGGLLQPNETQVQKYTSGIRKALAYLTYARLFRADGTIIAEQVECATETIIQTMFKMYRATSNTTTSWIWQKDIYQMHSNTSRHSLRKGR